MPSTVLLEQLKSAIASSKSFGHLPESEKAKALSDCRKASDEQVLAIIQDIESQDQKLLEKEQARLRQEQKQIELAVELQHTIKKVIKDKLKYDEANLSLQEETVLKKMEQTLKSDSDAENQKNTPPPRKKFLGLF